MDKMKPGGILHKHWGEGGSVVATHYGIEEPTETTAPSEEMVAAL